MVKCGVLFEVRTEFLNIIQMNFGFEGLRCLSPFAVRYNVFEVMLLAKFEFQIQVFPVLDIPYVFFDHLQKV
jgi:hypothetical protein